MSHTVNIKLIADQEIRILGEVVNVHDIDCIILDHNGNIIEVWKNVKKVEVIK